jgi:hypothetical protein
MEPQAWHLLQSVGQGPGKIDAFNARVMVLKSQEISAKV